MKTSYPKQAISYLVLPDGWDTGWKAAKSGVASSPAWIAGIGTSIMQGTTLTDILSGSAGGFFAQLRAKLLQSYSLYADCYTPMYSVQGGNTFSGTPPFAIAGTTGGSVSNSGLGDLYSYSSLDHTVTLTTPYACQSIDIIYTNATAGSFTYAVDGGGAVTVNPTGSGSTLGRVQIRGLSNATHSIVCSTQSAGGVMRIAGFACYSSLTAGLGFFHNGTNGRQTRSLIADQVMKNYAGAGGITGFPVQPHLTIIELSVNDLNNLTVGLDGFYWAMRRFVEALRKGQSNASVIFVAPSWPASINSDASTVWGSNSDYWPYYIDVMQRLCQEYTCALVNLHAKWGQTPVAQGLLVNGDVHPPVAGHTDIATTLLGVL